MKSKLKVECKHELVSSQAVNFFEDNTVFLLPIEYISCIRCNYTGILDSYAGKVIDSSSQAAQETLEQYKAKAREVKKQHESKIIQPTKADLKLVNG